MVTGMLLVAAAVVIAVTAIRSHRQEGSPFVARLAELAGMLGGRHVTEGTTGRAIGVHRGVTLVHHLVKLTAALTEWTEIEVPGLDGISLSLAVQSRLGYERPRIAIGRPQALSLGDPAFEDVFEVAGAPRELVDRVLTREVRGYLCGLDRERGVKLELEAIRDQCMRLTLRGWVVDPELARAAWDALVAVRAAACKAHEIGDGYRARPDTAARRTGWKRG
jgi:hypothetical protein